MAISVVITDGTETVTINSSSGDGLLENYVEQTADIDAAEQVETIEVNLVGGNAAVAATVAKLERLFQRARDRVGGAYGIDYVYMKVTLDSAVWRSPVRGGRIVTASGEWIRGDWALGTRMANIVLTREAWWEDDTERQISLTNGNGTDNTAGLNVYTCGDLSGSSPNKKDNTITVSGLLGDLPAPARFELALDGATTVQDVMISQNVYSTGATALMFEGDISAGSTTTTSGYSGGNYQSKTGASIIVTKDLSSIIDYLKGGYYRILARISLTDAINWKITPVVNSGSGYIYGKATTVTFTPFSAGYYSWWDLGVIQVPPLYIPGQTWNAVTVGWLATASSAQPFLLDCWQLTPLDGWKHIMMDGTIGATGSLHIDESMERAYAKNAAGKLTGYGTTTGDRLRVYPNVSQVFRLLWNVDDSPISNVTGYMVAKMYYRPRRRTL